MEAGLLSQRWDGSVLEKNGREKGEARAGWVKLADKLRLGKSYLIKGFTNEQEQNDLIYPSCARFPHCNDA